MGDQLARKLKAGEAVFTAWSGIPSQYVAEACARTDFDTVVLDEASERRLYEKMATLLDGFAVTLDAVIADITQRREELKFTSAALVAELLIDLAAYRLVVPVREQQQVVEALERLRQAARKAEQDCVDRLIEFFRFRPGDFLSETLPIEQGSWGSDLFDPGALAEFGIATGGAAASGALAGLAIDVVVGGMTLGAAALTGGIVGALTGALGSRGRRWLDGLRGYSELRASTATLELLARRQVSLVRALLRRGHASQDRIRLVEEDSKDDLSALMRELLGPLKAARRHPEWSSLDRARFDVSDEERAALKQRLTRRLTAALRG